MSWMLCESSQSLSELALALMWICYCVRRTQQLCPRPNSMLRKSDSVEGGGTTAVGVNLEANWKPNLGPVFE
jgi:hypothetical protein